MKTCIITLLSVIFALSSIVAQQAKNYKGAYANGYAEYEYTENENMLRLWNGRFSFADTMEIVPRGECDIRISGAFKNDKKAAIWVATIKGTDGNSLETATGPYKDGAKTGLWTHRLTLDDQDVKVATATFNQNGFRGKFNYSYLPKSEAASNTYKKLLVSGSFDNNGMLDGDWIIEYKNADGVEYKEVMRYQHGVLTYKTKHEIAAGKEIERFEDKAKMVAKFWSELQLPDSNAVVGEMKYGVVKKMTTHPILTALMKAWNDERAANISNQYASSIPTMMVDHGDLKSKKYLMCEQELVLWKDTPKGQKEWLQQQRIDKEYSSKIKMAEAARNEKDYEEALKHYRVASTVKKEETYPREQIPVLEALIVERDAKQRLKKTIDEKRSRLLSAHREMIRDEEFEKKQGKLLEAYELAYGAEKRAMKASSSKVISYVDQGNLEGLGIPEMELYEAALSELLDMQTKVKGLVGKDTKELEKELKKLEDPDQIVKILKR